MLEEWKTVTRKTKRRIGKENNTSSNCVEILSNINFTKSDIQHEISKVEKASEELIESAFFHKFCKYIETVLIKYENDCHEKTSMLNEIVCYGLGSVSNSYIARYQLAMLILLLKFLSQRTGNNCGNKPIPCYVYDPIFNNFDVAILENFKLKVLSENEEGRRKGSSEHGISIFYMIHCDKFLYDNLLCENLENRTMDKIIVIGNSFKTMWERLPESVLKNDYKLIYKIISEGLVSETMLDNWKDNDAIFNDTSIHCFRKFSLT
uniref:SRR1-like protein n=1 Tax=Styela clava TaxID=7725 RepID=UPI00193985E4|nr:SRR1-like protein [Styela clava]